jgi:toluene monooxygenase system protein E
VNRTAPPSLRTYSHLAARKRVPSDYDIVTSRLLYYLERGFEIDVPVAPWYRRHQQESGLRLGDWERFVDPRETTYTSYTALQADREQHLDALMRSIERTDHDRHLPAEWRALLDQVLPPLRYVWHGFQMMAAYVGQMAPSGRLTLVAMFQGADEMRRIHRIAHRLGQLRHSHPGFAGSALSHWQEAPIWQPLRRVLELCLTRYDWGEAFVALCLCLKPLIDQLMVSELSTLARARQDFFLAEILLSLDEDCRWHRAWAGTLVHLVVEESSDNALVIWDWVQIWLPQVREAGRALASFWGPQGEATLARVDAAVMGWLKDLGSTPSAEAGAG